MSEKIDLLAKMSIFGVLVLFFISITELIILSESSYSYEEQTITIISKEMENNAVVIYDINGTRYFTTGITRQERVEFYSQIIEGHTYRVLVKTDGVNMYPVKILGDIEK